MNLKSLFILIASLSVFFTLQAIYWIVKSRKDKKQALLTQRLRSDEDEGREDDGLFREKVEGSLALSISQLMRAAGEEGDVNTFFQRALVYASIGFLAGLIILKGIVSAVIFGCLGPYFLYIRLANKRDSRVDQVEQQLPEALEMMIISLRAGQSLEQTFALNARELPAPIGDEFQQVSEEVRLGLSMEDALKALCARLAGAKTVRSFVVSVLVLRQTGGNLIEVFEAIIDTMRQQSQYEHKLKSMTAESRSNARTLGALPPIFIAISLMMSPDYIKQVTSHSMGQLMMFVSFALYIIGFVWVRRLVKPRH